jgi:hypothetical protein
VACLAAIRRITQGRSRVPSVMQDGLHLGRAIALWKPADVRKNETLPTPCASPRSENPVGISPLRQIAASPGERNKGYEERMRAQPAQSVSALETRSRRQ